MRFVAIPNFIAVSTCSLDFFEALLQLLQPAPLSGLFLFASYLALKLADTSIQLQQICQPIFFAHCQVLSCNSGMDAAQPERVQGCNP